MSRGKQIIRIIDKSISECLELYFKSCRVKNLSPKTLSIYEQIRNRISLLSEELSPKMAIHSTLITTYGLKYNEYSGDFVNVIDMDALFE